MTEEDKRNCCMIEIQETEAKYYKTLEDIEKVHLLHPRSTNPPAFSSTKRSIALITVTPPFLSAVEFIAASYTEGNEREKKRSIWIQYWIEK